MGVFLWIGMLVVMTSVSVWVSLDRRSPCLERGDGGFKQLLRRIRFRAEIHGNEVHNASINDANVHQPTHLSVFSRLTGPFHAGERHSAQGAGFGLFALGDACSPCIAYPANVIH